MFLAAARTIAELSPARQDPEGNLLPPLCDLRNISFQVALAVAARAQSEGLAQPCGRDEAAIAIKSKMWEPVYAKYQRRTG